MGLDCSMLWRGGKSSQAVGTAGLFGACHRDTLAVRRIAASSRIAQEPGVRQRGSGVEQAEGSASVAQVLQRWEQCWRRGCDNGSGGSTMCLAAAWDWPARSGGAEG